MLTTDEVRALGDVTNTTWGKSSTTKVPTMSLKCALVGDQHLKISYVTTVTFASDRAMSEHMSALENDAVQASNQYLSEIKREFKKITGTTLKTRIKDTIPSVEIIRLQPHISPKRTAYYRFVTMLEIE